jgi:hypothetical protein
MAPGFLTLLLDRGFDLRYGREYSCIAFGSYIRFAFLILYSLHFIFLSYLTLVLDLHCFVYSLQTI